MPSSHGFIMESVCRVVVETKLGAELFSGHGERVYIDRVGRELVGCFRAKKRTLSRRRNTQMFLRGKGMGNWFANA